MLVKTSNTTFSDQEAFVLFFDGWVSLFKADPTVNAICVLFSQRALETGHFQSMNNWNFGNIKHTSSNLVAKDHDYCLYECGEFIHGQFQMFYPPDPVCEFNSYVSAKDGIIEYISFLAKRERYASAWQQLLKGDPVQYCKELKENGPYFTAPLVKYTGTLVKLFNEFKIKFKELFETKSKEIQDLSFMKEEIEEKFIRGLTNISEGIHFDVEYPKYNSGVVWITLDYNKQHILIEWQKDVGYGIHYDDPGGFPVIERHQTAIMIQAIVKEIFEI